jgi:hypothetical protein
MIAVLAVACTFAAHGRLPDPVCTPGIARRDATVAQICAPGYAERRPSVPPATRRRVFVEYGIAPSSSFPRWELDWRVPFSLGGSASLRNLWPQRDPLVKDRLERRYHDGVCSGAISLAAAQRHFLGDWRESPTR